MVYLKVFLVVTRVVLTKKEIAPIIVPKYLLPQDVISANQANTPLLASQKEANVNQAVELPALEKIVKKIKDQLIKNLLNLMKDKKKSKRLKINKRILLEIALRLNRLNTRNFIK